MCTNAVKWLYRLESNFSWRSPFRFQTNYVFFDKEKKPRLVLLKNGEVVVTEGYCWNGCSPKVCVLDLLIGTPEGVVHVRSGRPKTAPASMVHDAMYQFLSAGLPLTRAQADRAFLDLLREYDFLYARIYWIAVRLFGRLVLAGKRKARKWAGSFETIDDAAVMGLVASSA
jgi:hypothetical protein